MGISDRKRSIESPVNINLDLNQEPKPNQFLIENNIKSGDFVSRKKSGNIFAGSKLNVEGQGIYNVKVFKNEISKKLAVVSPVSEGLPPTPTPTPSITPSNTPTPNIQSCLGAPYNLYDFFDIPQLGNVLFGDINIFEPINNPDEIISGGGFYFNSIDYLGVDRTSFFSNFFSNDFTLTLCQNNIIATFSGNSSAFTYADFGPPYGNIFFWESSFTDSLIQIVSANTTFNYNEIVYINCSSIVVTPTPTPTNTQTPTITPTVTQTNTPTNTTTPTPTPTLPPSFISVWRTTTPSESITLPYVLSGSYSGIIDWGDSTTSTNSYVNRTHTYTTPGNYTITISGFLIGWSFNSVPTSRSKIREVLQWGSINLSLVTNHFQFCNNLVLTGVTDTPNLTGISDLSGMFNYCSNVTTINNINNWNVSDVTNMSGMFDNSSFNQSLSGWNVSNVTDMSGMFADSPFNNNINNWDVSSVTNMSRMFEDSQFNSPLSGWNVSNVTDMSRMFVNTPFNQPINNWDVSGVTNMGRMFDGSSFNQPLSGWDVSNVVDMNRMFALSPFNNNIEIWNVSSVTNMSGMFNGPSFNQPLSNWERTTPDISTLGNVSNMSSMFGSSPFNQPINNWNVSGVTNMSLMFISASFNQPLSGWNVSNVTDMSNMFTSTVSFDQNIGNWNVSNVVDMSGMFFSSPFNQPLSGWNVSNVTDMSSMFFGSPFNQPINNWDVSSVTNMNSMFNGSSFNQDIGNWNISGVTNFIFFMDTKTPSTFSTTNLDSIYNGWSSLPSVQSGINITFGSAKYTSASSAGKSILQTTYGWTITDGGI